MMAANWPPSFFVFGFHLWRVWLVLRFLPYGRNDKYVNQSSRQSVATRDLNGVTVAFFLR